MLCGISHFLFFALHNAIDAVTNAVVNAVVDAVAGAHRWSIIVVISSHLSHHSWSVSWSNKLLAVIDRHWQSSSRDRGSATGDRFALRISIFSIFLATLHVDYLPLRGCGGAHSLVSQVVKIFSSTLLTMQNIDECEPDFRWKIGSSYHQPQHLSVSIPLPHILCSSLLLYSFYRASFCQHFGNILRIVVYLQRHPLT